MKVFDAIDDPTGRWTLGSFECSAFNANYPAMIAIFLSYPIVLYPTLIPPMLSYPILHPFSCFLCLSSILPFLLSFAPLPCPPLLLLPHNAVVASYISRHLSPNSLLPLLSCHLICHPLLIRFTSFHFFHLSQIPFYPLPSYPIPSQCVVVAVMSSL